MHVTWFDLVELRQHHHVYLYRLINALTSLSLLLTPSTFHIISLKDMPTGPPSAPLSGHSYVALSRPSSCLAVRFSPPCPPGRHRSPLYVVAYNPPLFPRFSAPCSCGFHPFVPPVPNRALVLLSPFIWRPLRRSLRRPCECGRRLPSLVPRSGVWCGRSLLHQHIGATFL